MPADAAPGDYAVLAACFESRATNTAPFRVFRHEIFTVTPGPAVNTPAPDGTFQLSATSGPAGTVVTVSDADGDCVVPAGAPAPHVEVLLLDEGAVATERRDLPADGSFSVPLTIPANLKPAPSYGLVVQCVANAPGYQAPNDRLASYQYMTRTFAVTGPAGQAAVSSGTTAQPVATAQSAATSAPAARPVATARPATAVAGQPRFTG